MSRRATVKTALFLGATLLVAPFNAHAQTLYDGTAGTKPGAQGWLTFGNFNKNLAPPFATETYDSTGKVTTVNTTADSNIYAGYSNYLSSFPTANGFTPSQFVNASFPTLDSTAGYSLDFTMQLSAESHSNNARSGFSVLVIGSDLKGVEIGFHSADLFSQSSTFSAAETVNTPNIAALTSGLTSYSVKVANGSYTLFGGGTALLSGSLKDYTGATGFGTDVYRTRNFVFLGDDTSSAQGTYSLRAVSVAAPEPASGVLVALSFAGLIGRRRWKKRTA